MICNNLWLGYTQGPAITPRLYEIMQSLVGTPDGSTNPYELAAAARAFIFNFDYDLHQESKETFEKNILEYFMMRRLGYETYTLWHIKFKNRILTILPKYNALFDYQAKAYSLIDEDISGKSYSIEHIYGSTNTNTKDLSDALTHGLVSESNGTLDSRQSDTPQNNIDEVKSGEYLSNYNYDQSGNKVTNSGTDETKHTGTDTNAHTGTDTDRYSESLASPEKLELLAKYQASIQNIYTQIYKELDSLFSIF